MIQIGITSVAKRFEADEELSCLTVVGFGAFAIFLVFEFLVLCFF